MKPLFEKASVFYVQFNISFQLVKYYDSPINKVAVLVSVPTTILGEREPFLTLQSVVVSRRDKFLSQVCCLQYVA